MTGSADTRLAVLRGNSGSGKSTTAQELRRQLGRGIAWVEQDHFRRIVLREHDRPGGVNAGLIGQTVRYSLDNGYDVILEGILYAAHYGDMLRELCADHLGTTGHYYFDIPFEETIARHSTRPLARDVTVENMRQWYRPRDLLDFVDEHIIDEKSSISDTTQRIISEMNWGSSKMVKDHLHHASHAFLHILMLTRRASAVARPAATSPVESK